MKYFRWFFVALIFFLIGLFFGMHINPLSVEKIALLLKSTSTTFDVLNIQFSFFLTSLNNCTVSRELINSLSKGVSEIGRTLQKYDERNIKNNFYYFLKENYHLFQIKLYLLYKIYKERCDSNENVILFFWGKNNESIIQGKILDDVVKKTNVHVFAVEKGFSEAYGFLEQYYQINETPCLIVNYVNRLCGLIPEAEIIHYLEK